jgi:uncharacterized RDD family membrane protein YckC
MNHKSVELAPIKLRLISLLIDLIILTPYTFLWGKLLRECLNLAGDEMSQLLVYASLIPIYFAGIFLFMILPEGLWGQTFGKWLMRIKVVDKTDLTPEIIGSVIRHFLDPIDMCFLVGYWLAHRNRSKQRIGDKVAHTIVIKKI